jgi:hypothetical protein
VCEGQKDHLFFQRFIEVLGLPRFYIAPAHGKNNIGRALDNFRIENTKIWANLKDVVIVGDNDDTKKERFDDICAQVADVEGLIAPDAPLKPSRSRPRCTILMIPWTETHGTLESLCVEAARKAHAKSATHVDAFLDLAHWATWTSESRRGKAWLRSNLAIRSRDPFVQLGSVFEEPKYRPLIPISRDVESFKRIADVLATF